MYLISLCSAPQPLGGATPPGLKGSCACLLQAVVYLAPTLQTAVGIGALHFHDSCTHWCKPILSVSLLQLKRIAFNVTSRQYDVMVLTFSSIAQSTASIAPTL